MGKHQRETFTYEPGREGRTGGSCTANTTPTDARVQLNQALPPRSVHQRLSDSTDSPVSNEATSAYASTLGMRRSNIYYLWGTPTGKSAIFKLCSP